MKIIGPIIVFKIIAIVIAVTIFLFFANGGYTFADHVITADPDQLQIEYARGYENLKEDGDLLIVGKYNIEYSSIPTHPVTETFLFRFIDPATGTELQSVEATAFNNLGYGKGAFAFYFDEAEVTAQSITFGGTYTAKIQGNPAAFPSPPTIETTTITWRPTIANVFHLNNDVVDIAQELEIAWISDSVILLATAFSGLVFTTEGELYFEQVIPNLRNILPSLFTGSVTQPNFDEIDATFNQDLEASIDAQDQWRGDWVAYTDDLATKFNVPAEIVRTAAWFFFSGVIALAFFVASKNTTFVMIILALLFTLGGLLNLVNVVLIALSTFGLAVMVMWQLFYNRASA